VVIHVDNCYVIGSEENIDQLVAQLAETGLKVKVEKETKDYLGCEIIISIANNQAWLGQLFIGNKMLTRFMDVIGTSKIQYKTLSRDPRFQYHLSSTTGRRDFPRRLEVVLFRCWYDIISHQVFKT
jgi:hypothetical protein